MLRVAHWIERLPVRCAATGPATYGPERAITLDVLLRVLRVTFDLNGTNLVVGPHCSESAADGAIAACTFLGYRWQAQFHGAAVARAFK